MTIRLLKGPGDEITFTISRDVLASIIPAPRTPSVPVTITQDNCLEVFGVKPETFLAFARANRFPNEKRGRLRVANYDDVKAFLTRRPDLAKTKADIDAIDHEAVIAAAVQRMRK